MKYKIRLFYKVDDQYKYIESNEVVYEGSKGYNLIPCDIINYLSCSFTGNYLTNKRFYELDIFNCENGNKEVLSLLHYTKPYNSDPCIYNDKIYSSGNSFLDTYSLETLELLSSTKLYDENSNVSIVDENRFLEVTWKKLKLRSFSNSAVLDSIPFDNDITKVKLVDNNKKIVVIDYNSNIYLINIDDENLSIISQSTLPYQFNTYGLSLEVDDSRLLLYYNSSLSIYDYQFNLIHDFSPIFDLEKAYLYDDKLFIARDISSQNQIKSSITTYSLDSFETLDTLIYPSHIKDFNFRNDILSIVHENSNSNYYLKSDSIPYL